ncbi:hypothetical protein ACH0CP_12720 [Sphingomonas sp. 179-I 2A4 NHS]|uniref:hypothetical protein n=1 Tax=unclassified Sphingomonas TaxID=196159 RepID=UPI003879388A
MKRLTEANYLSRRVKLTEQLTEAQNAFTDQSVRRELGEGTDDAVREAKAEVIGFEDRLVALDAAWERSRQMIAAEAQAAETAGAAEAHAAILGLLDQRTAAAVAMEDAARELARLYREYMAAGSGIIAHALEKRSRFDQQQLANLRDLIAGDFNDVRNPLGRILNAGGLDFTGIAVRGFQTDSILQRSVRAFAEWQNTRVAGHVAVLVEEAA